MRHAASAALILALLCGPALAHGGQYKGPSDAGGPTGSGGSSAAPPTNPGGGPGAAPGTPSAGTAGTGVGTPGRGPSRGGTATSSGIELTESYEIWEFWWENNKDQYLDLKSRLAQGVIRTGNKVSQLTGLGRHDDVLDTSRASRQTIDGVVIPALIELLHSSDNRDILDSAVLALGRTARAELADQVIEAAQPLLGHKELSVQTAATLCLGVLGSPKSVPVLTELMANTSKGQQIAGGDVQWLVRAFAALSLGLINDPASVEPLISLVENTADSETDVKVCAIVGLGLMDNQQTPKAFEFLVQKLEDRKLDAVIKSYIPTSLAKMAHGTKIEAKAALLKTFLNKDTDNYVRQSAAIALGLLGSMSDKEIVESLLQYIDQGKDMQTRHFGFIALAEIGKRDKDGSLANATAHATITELFAKEIVKPSVKSNRSWAALAAAIYAREIDSAQGLLIDQLGRAYDKESDPSFKSAFALSLGLLNARVKARQIHEDFLELPDQDFRGYAAVALGFMNYTEAADDLRTKCQDKTITPTFRLQVATGLGLMADTQAVKVLVSTLKDAQTLGVSSAVAKALGIIGDESAIDPLKNIAFDATAQDITRAFACVALGIVCEKTDLPWNARISQDNNYRARVPAIDEVLDIL